MAQRKTLTEKQVRVLRWIGDGCPERGIDDEFHRITAGALRNRGLITTAGRGPTWTAKITDAGRAYLAQVDSPNPPIPRQANVSVTDQLIADLVAAGGTIRVPRKDWQSPKSVDYERRVRSAERLGRVPAGKRLRTKYVDGDLEIRLEDGPPGTDVELRPVPVPATIARLHPVAKHFRNDAGKHEVSRAQLTRAVHIVHALALEAERRAWTIENVDISTRGPRGERWSAASDGHLKIGIRGHTYRLRVSEEKVSARGAFANDSPHLRPAGRIKYDSAATGRLQIAAGQYGREGRPHTWSDRASWMLEEKLPEVFRELEVRAAEDDHRAAERERQAEERRRNWERAMEIARERFTEHSRAETLRRQASAWDEASRLRAYLEALEQRHGRDPQTAEWIEWIRMYVDEHVDPLASAPSLSPDPEPQPEDLKPFLGGLSPYGPQGW